MTEMKIMKNFKLVNERLEKLEKIMKRLLDIEEENFEEENFEEENIDSDYSPSSSSEDSLEFKEFLDEDIWETNKNENKECNECGSVDIEKDAECEGDQFVFWCNQCNSHVGASKNEYEKDEIDIEWCNECDYFVCKCNEIENRECYIYVSKKRNISDTESDTESDDIKINFKKIKYL